MTRFSLAEDVRNGFLVDEKRKKVWAIELDLLDRLQNVCDKYGIRCFATAGTLLGAVRHQGFIPWDDDLDVAMSRKDFDILCKVGSSEFTAPYFFQTSLTDRAYFLGYARLRNSETTAIVTDMDKHIYNNGIFVDIFVYDVLPENSKRLASLVQKLNTMKYLLLNYYFINSRKLQKQGLLQASRAGFHMLRHFTSYEQLYERYRKLCISYSESDGNMLGYLCSPNFLHYSISRGDEDDLYSVPFENTTILIPRNFDEILKRSYGDYMKFPPIEKRGKWHEGMIIFDPDIPYIQYYKQRPAQYSSVLDEMVANG